MSHTHIQYLSPSSIGLWHRDRDEWVRRYMGLRRDVQTLPMGIGSAFDALVKQSLTGEDWSSQVSCEQAGLAWELGRECYDYYNQCGGMAELQALIGGRDVICEGRVTRRVDCGGTLVPILGIPDLVVPSDTWVVLDWKVNGVMSSASPAKGYIDKWCPGRRGHRVGHKDCVVGVKNGVRYNMSSSYAPVWREQLGTYALVAGVDLGMMVVHQITQRNDRDGGRSYTLTAHGWYEDDLSWLMERYALVWQCIKADHIYDGLSIDESRDKVDAMTRLYHQDDIDDYEAAIS